MTEPVKTSALGQADRDRTTGRQFLLRRLGWLGMAILLAGVWPMIWNANGKVAPTGVATPAGPRHAGIRPARVASITPEERHFRHWSVVSGQSVGRRGERGRSNEELRVAARLILHPSSLVFHPLPGARSGRAV